MTTTNLKNSRLLIVDDFSHTRALLKAFLQALGYTRIEEATDGDDALNKLKQSLNEATPFACVFSDWNMPKMNGIDLLRACRADDRLKQILFIVVTVESEKEYLVKAMHEGATAIRPTARLCNRFPSRAWPIAWLRLKRVLPAPQPDSRLSF